MILYAIYSSLFAMIPLSLISFHRKSFYLLRILPILFILLLIDNISVLARPLHLPLYWNWIGKFQEFLWPLVAVFVFKLMSAKDVGYSSFGNRSSWLLSILLGLGIGLACFGLQIGIDIFIYHGKSHAISPPLLETLLFQATMPGLAEEPVFRGIYLALFNRYFDRPWKLFGARIGWGVILTTLLFAAVHILSVSIRTETISWNPLWIFPNIFIAFIFGWLREKTGSVWPCVFVHNLTNVMGKLGDLIVNG